MSTNEHECNGNVRTPLVNVNELRCPFHPIPWLGEEDLSPSQLHFLHEESCAQLYRRFTKTVILNKNDF